MACACILPVGYENKAIKDSKVLSIKKREELAEVIKQNCIAYAIAYVDAPRIDLIKFSATLLFHAIPLILLSN